MSLRTPVDACKPRKVLLGHGKFACHECTSRHDAYRPCTGAQGVTSLLGIHRDQPAGAHVPILVLKGHEVDGWLLPTGGPPGQRKTSANQAP